MTVAQGVALFITHGFEELVDPDGGVDGETLPVESGEVGRACGGGEYLPEALDTHVADKPSRRASEAVGRAGERCRDSNDESYHTQTRFDRLGCLGGISCPIRGQHTCLSNLKEDDPIGRVNGVTCMPA